MPRRGLEIGGLLLGRVEREDDVTVFEIEGFEPLESEHRSGPSYVLSESDLARLDAIIARQGPSCLGMYRSHTRPGQPILQQADLDLLDRHFREHDGLFLVLIPAQGGAALFARTGGNLMCVHEFPLSSSIQTKSHVPASSPPPPPPEEPASPPKGHSIELPMAETETPETVPEPDSPQVSMLPEAPQPYSRKIFGYDLRSVLWMIAGILVPLGFVIATSMLSPSVSRSAARSAPLPQVVALSVDQSGRLLTLRWNGNAPVLQTAARAILHIEDGDYQHDRHLDLRELRNGRLTYEARTPEVIFQLEIYGQQPSAIGYTHVTNLARAIPSPPSETVERETQDQKKEEIPVPTTPQPAATRPAPPPVTDPPSNIAVVPPQAREIPAVVEHKPVDPVLVADAPKPPSQPVHSSNSDLASQPIERRASIDVSTEPVTPSLLGRVVEKVPLLRRARKQVTAAPVPVYQAKPSLDAESIQKIEEPVSIAVKVSVAQTGAVRDAEVVDYGEPPNWGAANAALKAARRWTFEPARAEDAVVPGEIVLRFRFNP